MGIDFLDFTFRVEKVHHLRFNRSGLKDFFEARVPFENRVCLGIKTKAWDWRVGTFFELSRKHTQPICVKCRVLLPESPGHGICPGCGEAYDRRELTWEQFCEALANVTGEKAAEISKEQWMKRDLNFY